ncbi:MAG: DUF1294 domain-containing protein [Anaerolineae bacterium]|nr:DUF1294 domain-containing protein [Anaerolineae bacterium]MDW8071167.1 DUF1294 domain-containing protein [Anaerolineae bacterium]
MPYLVFAITAILPLAVLFALLNARLNWPEYLIWLVAVNITTFGVYGLDKVLSQIRWLRVPNVLLLGLAVIGGFLGATLARLVFRHKTDARRYTSYSQVIAASALVHIAIIWYFFLRAGR